MRAAILVVIGLASVATAAPSKPPRPTKPLASPKSVADSVAAANQAMAAADFDKALTLLDGALGKATLPADVVTLNLLRGQALIALDRSDAAQKAFAAALAIDPNAELDASSANPSAMSAMAKARGQLMSDLTVSVTNGTADVKLDDVDLGPAPLKTRVGAGKHHLEAVGAKGQRATKEFDVKAGKPFDLALELLTDAPVRADPTVTTPSDWTPPPTPIAAITTTHRSRSVVGLVPLGVGVVAIGAGVGLMLQAQSRHGQLIDPRGPRLDPATEQNLASQGALFQTIGVVAFGVGGAAIATGALMLILSRGGEDAPRVSALVLPDGAFVGLSSAF